MSHKVFISFKTEDAAYKKYIQDLPNLDYVDKSLNVAINSEDPDYVLQRIRSDYLYDSTVTIFLIGARSAETLGQLEQYYVKKELQASLFNSSLTNKSGILGVVLPDMNETIFGGTNRCWNCGNEHTVVRIDESTAISEFAYNYYIPNGKCAHSEEDRYCVLAS